MIAAATMMQLPEGPQVTPSRAHSRHTMRTSVDTDGHKVPSCCVHCARDWWAGERAQRDDGEI